MATYNGIDYGIEDSFYQHGSTKETGVGTPAHLINAYLSSQRMDTSDSQSAFFSKYGLSGQKTANYWSAINSNPDLANRILSDIRLANPNQVEQFKQIEATPASGVTAQMRATNPELAQAKYDAINQFPTQQPQQQGGDFLSSVTAPLGSQERSAQLAGLAQQALGGQQQPAQNGDITGQIGAVQQSLDVLNRAKQAGMTITPQTSVQDAQKFLGEEERNFLTENTIRQSTPQQTTPSLQAQSTLNTYKSAYKIKESQEDFFADPIKTIKDLTKQVFDSLGMGEANQIIKGITKEIEDIQNKKSDEARAINDDPWLTEGVRQRRLQSLDKKYEDRLSNKLDTLKLYENARDDAQQQAQYALNTAIGLWDSERQFQQQQTQLYYNQAQREFDNNFKLAEANRSIEEWEADFALKQFEANTARYKATTGAIDGDNPQLYGGLTPQTATAVRSKVSKFSTEPIVQNFATIQEGYNFAQSISSQTTNPADDQALIYALAKTLDPGSVVREGEYATAQKYSQSWISAYGKSISQALAGTGFLSQEARNNIKKTIETKFKSSATSYNNLYSQYSNGINSLTGRSDGANFLIDYTTPTPVTSSSATAQLDQIVGGSSVQSTQTGSFFGDFFNKVGNIFGI